MKAYKRDIDSLVLVPADGGAFEVKKNGKLVFSKLAAERFPEDGEIKAIFSGNKQPVTS